jgi:hypothetical protein
MLERSDNMSFLPFYLGSYRYKSFPDIRVHCQPGLNLWAQSLMKISGHCCLGFPLYYVSWFFHVQYVFLLISGQNQFTDLLGMVSETGDRGDCEQSIVS